MDRVELRERAGRLLRLNLSPISSMDAGRTLGGPQIRMNPGPAADQEFVLIESGRDVHVIPQGAVRYRLDRPRRPYQSRALRQYGSHDARIYGAWRVQLHPPERELLADLRAEYTDPPTAFVEHGEVFSRAGWATEDAWRLTHLLHMATPEDLEAVTSRSPLWWDWVGWTADQPVLEPVPAADALRLAEAGISYEYALALAAAGRSTVEEKLKRMPPSIPDSATRVVLDPYLRRDGSLYGGNTFQGPEEARRRMAHDPSTWWPDYAISATGPRLVHAGQRWTLWDDGVLLQNHGFNGDRVESLPDAAIHALDLFVGSADFHERADLPWPHYVGATAHATAATEKRNTYLTQYYTPQYYIAELTRTDYTLADGTTRTLWRVDEQSFGDYYGEGQMEPRYHVYADEAAARAAFTHVQGRD